MFRVEEGGTGISSIPLTTALCSRCPPIFLILSATILHLLSRATLT